MDVILLYLRLQPWLKQWLVNEQGEEPVKFLRNSTENDILQIYLKAMPKDATPDKPDKDTVAIVLPQFKKKDTRVYNYLDRHGKALLRNCIRSRMILAMWNDLSQFGNIGKQTQDLIWAWMETNGIELNETNFCALQKIYQRRRNAYLKKKYRENLPDFKKKK